MNSESKPETPANVCATCGQEQLGKTNRCWKCGAVLIERKRLVPTHLPHYQFPQNLATGETQYFYDVSAVEDIIIAEIIDEVLLAPSDEQRTAEATGVTEANPKIEPAAAGHQTSLSNASSAAPVVRTPALTYQPPQGIPFPVHQGSPFQNNPYAIDTRMHVAPQAESVWMPGMEDYTARGGAVAAFVIGIVTILGGLITGFAILNGILGVGLGIWGLNSKKKKTAMLGIGLCILGILVTLVVLMQKASSPAGPGVF